MELLNDGNQLTSNNCSDYSVMLNTDESFHGVSSPVSWQNGSESLKLDSSESLPSSSLGQCSADIKLFNAETAPYGRVKQTFTSQNPSEPSLRENIVVFLMNHVDPHWTEVEVDDKSISHQAH